MCPGFFSLWLSFPVHLTNVTRSNTIPAMKTEQKPVAVIAEDPDLAGFESLRRDAEAEGLPQDGSLSARAMAEIRWRAAGGGDTSND